jgi:hypothetical protein
MPAQRPCAAFEPIPPDLDVTALVESTPNFEFAVRIHCDAIDEQGLENFEKLVLLHVILGGKPLIIEGYENRLEKWIFSEQWLRDNHATKSTFFLHPLPSNRSLTAVILLHSRDRKRSVEKVKHPHDY